MDCLDQLRSFREVAERGSFSRAATLLGVSKATVSKSLSQLEEAFGVRLLNRSTRYVSLTDAGQMLLERSRPLIEMVELTHEKLLEYASHARGRVRITAPHGFAQSNFPRILSEFVKAYPDIHISLQLSNDVIDLVEEGVDIALRLGRIGNDNLIVRRLRRMDLVLCAAPAYWARHRFPSHPDDMRSHAVLTYSLLEGPPHLSFEVDGERYIVPVASRMDANDAAPLIDAALAGIGVVCVPAMMARGHVERGALVPVLQEYMPRDIWLYAAYSQRRNNSIAMRTLVDFLEAKVNSDVVEDPA